MREPLKKGFSFTTSVRRVSSKADGYAGGALGETTPRIELAKAAYRAAQEAKQAECKSGEAPCAAGRLRGRHRG